MIVSTNQPYFCPFPGFFYKVQRSDLFVILDTVQFPRGTTWITRNRFKNDQGTLWITVPVWKKGLGLQRIDEVRICYDDGRWRKKHLESLSSAYVHAPFFSAHRPFIEHIFSTEYARLADLNLEVIRYLMESLQIKTDVVLLSELNIHSKGSRLLVDICKAVGSSRYLAQSAAKKYLDQDLFKEAGIELDFFRYPSLTYPQLWGDFIQNLSAFDILFNCGPKARDLLFQ